MLYLTILAGIAENLSVFSNLFGLHCSDYLHLHNFHYFLQVFDYE